LGTAGRSWRRKAKSWLSPAMGRLGRARPSARHSRSTQRGSGRAWSRFVPTKLSDSTTDTKTCDRRVGWGGLR
jgi:hypothetical protein